MRHILLSATIAVFGLGGAAMAATTESPAKTPAKPAVTQAVTKQKHKISIAKGVVKSFDEAKHELALTDGKVFHLRRTYAATAFKAGEEVVVKYRLEGEVRSATRVIHVKPHTEHKGKKAEKKAEKKKS